MFFVVCAKIVQIVLKNNSICTFLDKPHLFKAQIYKKSQKFTLPGRFNEN